MPQSLTHIVVHLVFSTKNREALISQEARPELFAYLGGALNALDCPALAVGGVADHVHLLFALNALDCPALAVGGVADHVHLLFVLSKNLGLSEVVEEVKKQSSKWAKGKVHPQFYWQGGYGAFSVSASNEAQVVAYIRNQEEHHREMTFQDEIRRLMEKHGKELNEQYFWE